jgi:polysaccharide export outer membrane protein
MSWKRIFFVLCGAGFCTLQLSYGQIQDYSVQDLLKMKSTTQPDASQLNSTQPTALDAPVTPSEYYVGPGDVLSLNIWSSAPVELRLTVTPEATLLIPNVGIVAVKDQTLDVVKKKIAKLVGERYRNSEVTLTLITPRRIVVQINGEVYQEGKYELNSLQRADNLIALANKIPDNLTDQQTYEKIMFVRRFSSTRHITIQRKNGERLRVDLVKFVATEEGKYNPYLREGDQIFLPPKKPSAIGVDGGVKFKGGYEFVEGDSLADLIAAGFGFSAVADSTHGVLSRLSLDGTTMEQVEVNPAAIVAGEQQNIALRPGDRLVVKEHHEFRESHIVVIEGEVKQSGQFPITRYQTKLSEIVRAAGGFTEDANLRGATLTRERVSPRSAPEEIYQEQLLSSRSNLGFQDTNYYFVETTLRLRGEIVSVDFYRLFVEGDSTQDITLRPFDRINIPKKTKTVYVFGQVLAPGHIEFVEGMDYRYYVQKASGFAFDAIEDDVKIIKGSTRVWLTPDETEIEDGDYIWVPKDRKYPFATHLNTYAQIATILGAVATVALLVSNLTSPTSK